MHLAHQFFRMSIFLFLLPILAACSSNNTSVVPDTTPPVVSGATVPATGDINVTVDGTIRVVFSEAMDATTINNTTITVDNGVTGVVTYDANTREATYTPDANLAAATTYTVTITTAVTDTVGNALAANYVWTFTTDATAPTVSGTTVPAGVEANVAVDGTIRVVFSEAMDATTINNTTITVDNGVTGVVTYDANTREATYTPDADLAAATTYTVTITTGVKDIAGNTLATNYAWSFSTVYTWLKRFGWTDGSERGVSMSVTADKGYAVAVRHYNTTADDEGAIIKLDESGALDWASVYGGVQEDDFYALMELAGGGYIAVGKNESYDSPNLNDAYIWVIKLDASGAVVWEKVYGTGWGANSWSYATTVDEVAGGYIVGGYTFSSGQGSADAWILKLNVDGTVAWQFVYGDANYQYTNAISVNADGSFIVTGYTKIDATDANAWVMKLSATGGLDWHNSYDLGVASWEEGLAVQQTIDGGFVVSGRTDVGVNGYDAWVLKLDNAGVIEWQKTYGGANYDVASYIEQVSDGGYVLTGRTESFGAGQEDVWLIKLAANGSVTWTKGYGSVSNDRAYSVHQTGDGGYAVAGYTWGFSASSNDAWVLKLDAEGGAGAKACVDVINTINLTPVDTAAVVVASPFTRAATGRSGVDSSATTTVTPAASLDEAEQCL